jgi:hypothetical protein
MPSDRSRGFLLDIKRNIDLAERFVSGMTVDEFERMSCVSMQ